MFNDPQADRAMAEALAAAPRRPVRGPWLQLLSALLGMTGGHGELLRHSERPWSSVTFSGSRHTVALLFRGPAAIAAGETFIDALPEHEFAIPRQLVADANVTAVDHTAGADAQMRVEVELLLLEDA